MKKLFFPCLILIALAMACRLPGQSPPEPTFTPTVTLTPTPVFSPTPLLPTSTPTLVPTATPVPALRIAAGERALFYGDWETALAAYQEALAASTGEDVQVASTALLGIGRAQYLAGQYPEALNALRDATQRDPRSQQAADAFFFLGLTYEKLDRWLDAADAYLNYLALRPGVLDAYLYERRGDALFAASDFPSALNDYMAAYKSPRLTDTLSLEIKIARVYAITGDVATAVVMYDDLYQRAPNSYVKAQVDYLKGQAYASIDQTDRANEAYVDAVTNYPFAYDAYLSLIELVDGGYPVSELHRGLTDYYAGEYGVALAAFDRYLADSPADPAAAYYYRGLALSGLGNYSAAVDQWSQVIDDYPASDLWDEAWEQKAYYQWAYLDDYAGGQQTLLGFVATVPQHARAGEFLFDAGRVAERDNRLADAAAIWARLAVEYPGGTYTYRGVFLAGICYYRLQNYAAAKDTFVQAHAFVPTVAESAAVNLWIGKSYQALGDGASARVAWEKAAALDPTGYYSERARDLLVGREPFASPAGMDLGIDVPAERAQAESWMHTAFGIPAETLLSDPGPLAADPRFQRGRAYWELGLYEEGRDEFESLRSSVENDAAGSYRLANALYDLGVYRTAVFAARQVLTLAGMDDAATLAAPAWFNHIRFGAYYPDLVIPAAQENDLHPLFVWSVIRQESLFEGYVRSSAGARGLMQIIPSTGESLAGQFHWPPNFTDDDLYRPLVSVRLGVQYLNQQRTYLGDLYAALAAYNAGPGNAAVWHQLAGNDPDLLLEVIRLEEPRRYITSIYELYNIYRELYERAP